MTNQLTKIFKALSGVDGKRESLAGQILAFLVEKGCRTLEQANEQFDIAYRENGWSKTAGRPKAGVKSSAAPDSVKHYVTKFRQAYAAGLDVLSFKTVTEMRTAILAHLKKLREEQEAQPHSLVGIQVAKEDVLTGALVHDICACIKAMPPGDRKDIEDKLRRVLAQAMKKAPPELKLVA